MVTPKALAVGFIAATARKPPRPAGIDAFIGSMIGLGASLAVPLFAAQLLVIRLATFSQPLRREPYLTLSIDSFGLGVIAAAELIRIWRRDIDAALGGLDALAPGPRRRRRLGWIGLGAVFGAAVLAGTYYGLIRR